MLALLEYLTISFLAVFVIVNPLTTAFIFIAMLPKATEEERKAIALRSTKVASALLIGFALLGGIIFQLFGITLAAFRIAGGIILFGIAMGMIRQTNTDERDTAKDIKADHPKIADDISVIPLAIPFMSGPGAIATVMVLTTEAPTIYHIGLVFLAVLACMATCYYAMIHSKLIVGYLGDTGKDILTKIFGLILAVLAVQFVVNGLGEVVTGYLLDHQMLDVSEVQDPRLPTTPEE
ncbi:MAG: MarC family protein [Pseudomonadota bacterium]